MEGFQTVEEVGNRQLKHVNEIGPTLLIDVSEASIDKEGSWRLKFRQSGGLFILLYFIFIKEHLWFDQIWISVLLTVLLKLISRCTFIDSFWFSIARIWNIWLRLEISQSLYDNLCWSFMLFILIYETVIFDTYIEIWLNINSLHC